MKDEDKTSDQLIDELTKLRRRVAELGAVQVESKQTYKAFGESEEKYRVLFEAAKDALFLCDKTGRFVDVNDAACK